MRFSKAFALILIICAVTIMPLFSSIEAASYGVTEQESKDNAYKALCSLIFGENIYVKSESSTSASSSSSDRSYKEDVSAIMNSSALTGVQYRVEKENNRYKCIATLSDSYKGFYLSRVRDAKKSLESIYNENQESESKRYENLLLAMKSYEDYKKVALALGVSPDDIPSVDIPETMLSLLDKYESALIGEQNELVIKKKAASDDAVNEITKQLEINRSNIQKINEEKKARTEQALEAKKATLEAVLESSKALYNNKFVFTYSSNLSEVIKEIDKAINNYNDIANRYDDILYKNVSEIDNATEIEVEAIKNRKYRTAELSLSGEPIAEAKAIRDEEIETYKAEKTKERQDTIKLIQSGLAPSIQEAYDEASSVILNYEKKNMVFNSSTDTLKVDRDIYDGNDCSWIFHPYLIINDEKIETPTLKVYYKALSGKDPVKGNSDYNDDVDRIEQLLDSGIYDFEVTCSLVVDAYGGVYRLYLQNISLYEFTAGERELKKGITAKGELIKEVELGTIMHSADYSFLDTESAFNSKADAINKEVESAKVAEEEKEKAIQAKENSRSAIKEASLNYYGTDRRIIFGIRGGFGYGPVIQNVNVNLLQLYGALDIEYLLLENVYITASPFIDGGIYYYSVKDSNKYESYLANKSAPMHIGVALGFGFITSLNSNVIDSFSFGTRFTINSISAYARFGKSSMILDDGMVSLEVGATYYNALNKSNYSNIVFFIGAGYAF